MGTSRGGPPPGHKREGIPSWVTGSKTERVGAEDWASQHCFLLPGLFVPGLFEGLAF